LLSKQALSISQILWWLGQVATGKAGSADDIASMNDSKLAIASHCHISHFGSNINAVTGQLLQKATDRLTLVHTQLWSTQSGLESLGQHNYVQCFMGSPQLSSV
jgi:hypothetical protein